MTDLIQTTAMDMDIDAINDDDDDIILTTTNTYLLSLPDECILEIFRYIDDTDMRKDIRLLNRRLSQLITPIVFEWVNFEGNRMKDFPQNLFHFVKNMYLDHATSPFETALALHKRSKVLKFVDLTFVSDLVVLEELVNCCHLEELHLRIMTGDQNSFNSLLNRVLGDKQRTSCWKKLQTLELTYNENERLALESIVDLCPNLNVLKLCNIYILEPCLLSGTITELDIRFDKILESFDDNGFFPVVFDYLPALEKLSLSIDCNEFEMPRKLVPTLTHLTLDVRVPDANAGSLVLENWCWLFPNLKHFDLILCEDNDNGSVFSVGEIQPDTGLQLSFFHLKFVRGPPIWEIINGLPNLTELNVDYTYWPNEDAESTLPPLGDMSKLLNLSITACTFGETNKVLTWLRESIWSSFQNAMEKKMVLNYIHNEEMNRDGVLRLWGTVSEVIDTLSVNIPTAFNPSLLDVLSRGLRVFSFTFLEDIEAAITSEEVRANNWRIAMKGMREKGISLEGDFDKFN